MNIRSILALAPVVPVLTIEHIDHAVPLARALSAGGLRVLEVTLRTPAALPAIEAMRKAVPEAVVGVGTLARPGDFVADPSAQAKDLTSAHQSGGWLSLEIFHKNSIFEFIWRAASSAR